MHFQKTGHIELVCGPMFSGKSTELLRRLQSSEIAGLRVLRVKFSGDERYEKDAIVTHDRKMHSALAASSLEELGDLWTGYDVIGIDEGQFFPDIVSRAESMANAGKVVIISALDATCVRTAFDTIAALIPKCEKIKKLQAVCDVCKGKASFHFRTVPESVTEMIGGQEMYKPVCRECHARLSQSAVPQQHHNAQKQSNRDHGDVSCTMF